MIFQDKQSSFCCDVALEAGWSAGYQTETTAHSLFHPSSGNMTLQEKNSPSPRAFPRLQESPHHIKTRFSCNVSAITTAIRSPPQAEPCRAKHTNTLRCEGK
jgi:hypothetical protein